MPRQLSILEHSTIRMVFKEIQRLQKWWALGIYALMVAFSLFAIIKWYIFHQAFGNIAANEHWVHISLLSIVVVILAFLLSIKLEIEITKEGIIHRFFPIEGNHQMILWSEIEECSVLKIQTYGIQGYRINRTSISGRWVIAIIKKDGTLLKLGTQKPELAEKAIYQYQWA